MRLAITGSPSERPDSRSKSRTLPSSAPVANDDPSGATAIDQTGVPFDPHVHEAVTMQPAASPQQDHTVGQVLQAGYKFGDILLRPARVVVLTWQGE